MKCARCGKEIPKGQEMTEKICGRYVPTHRDCAAPYETPESMDTMLRRARRDLAEKRRTMEKRRRR